MFFSMLRLNFDLRKMKHLFRYMTMEARKKFLILLAARNLIRRKQQQSKQKIIKLILIYYQVIQARRRRLQQITFTSYLVSLKGIETYCFTNRNRNWFTEL